MAAFSVMMENLAVEGKTHKVKCPRCGKVVEIALNHTSSMCGDCQKVNRREWEELRKPKSGDTGDPALNLVLAMVRQARIDKVQGNRDAWQWLATDAPLWLRACGIGVTRAMRNRLMEGK
ncbi:MAG TPA: hypothetical protein PK040_00410 [Anaerolineaceae bacterium]|nr:hypothetical protein [Anaerolineaceae bacterium]